MSDEYPGAPPEAPIEPEPAVAPRSRTPTILFAFALIAFAAGGLWFSTQLKPRTPAGGNAVAAAPDTAQIIHPRTISKGKAQITAADLPGFDAEGLTPDTLDPTLRAPGS